MSRAEAKRMLRAKGWSYRRVAPLLGVHHVHLALVLSGKRESKRLLAAIGKLPNSPTPYSHLGFALKSTKTAQ